MLVKIGVGKSKEKDAYKAGIEAAKIALTELGENTPDFVFLFATADYNQKELLKGVREVTKNAPLSGCSGEGIITQDGPEGESMMAESGIIQGESVAGVMVFVSDELKFCNCYAEGLKEGSKKAGKIIGNAIKNSDIKDPLMLLMFPDGLTVNIKNFFAGIDSQIKKPLTFCGGTAGDASTFTKTYQYFNDKVLTDSASCVLVSGNINFKIGVNHGCMTVGMEKTITKACNNIIYEIDNRPAWEVLKEYLDKDSFSPENVVAVGLGEKLEEDIDDGYGKFIIRAVLSQNKDESLNLPTEMPKNSVFWIARRDIDKISNGAKKMAEEIKDKLGGKKPIAVLHFDCSGRGTALFGKDVKEKGIDVMQDVIGKDVPWLGFYTYGEIAPIKNKNYVHNYTVVLCVFY